MPSHEVAVAPHAGVWIETKIPLAPRHRQLVAPHAGVWIETVKASPFGSFTGSRPPCGGVD